MDYYSSVTRTFAAAHSDKDCGPHTHGHSYRVEVVVYHDDDHGDWASGWAINYLDPLVKELALRSLNDMMPGSRADPMGIATWFMERLQLLIRVYEVNVWQDDQRATVRHE